MFKRKFQNLLFIFSLSFSSFCFADSPAGYWKTFDDVTGKVNSVINLWENSQHHLYGKIARIFDDPNKICRTCEGSRHNQKIVGMVVITNLKQSQENPRRWVDGQVFDPRSNNTYHCTIEVSPSNQKLLIRGYLGLPLFGRSQTWVRVNDPSQA